MKDMMNLYIQEIQKFQGGKTPRDPHQDLLQSNCQKPDAERVLKTAREKQFVIYNRSSMKLKTNSSSRTLEARKQ